ncbi:MAG: hypothetical protein KAI72_10855 [Candidatus Pacebacteria bacterium]|nr:hypothetical protein [Candidatus Paceibacterota bacterium]
MKNIKITLPVIIFLSVGGYFLGQSLTNNPMDTTAGSVSVSEQKPDRKSDIYGKVIKVEGNMVTLALIDVDASTDPTVNMTPEEKKEYKQSLSEEERMALKNLSLSSTLGNVIVTVPVGIPMSKKLGQGTDASETEATLADVSMGKILSVWINQDETERNLAEYIKVSGN